MAKYLCSVCGYIYDEAKGIPEAGIAPDTAWGDLPDDWTCPICGAAKTEFKKQGEDSSKSTKSAPIIDKTAEIREMSALEMSALCTNLARGCEKQYKMEEATNFNELAQYFKSVSKPTENADFGQLMALIEKDLEKGFPNANYVAKSDKDRGALRALVWSEKVTRIMKSLLTRYEKEGDSMLENTGVYVCTICGFIYIGDNLPEVCPICKVPNWKFERIEGGNRNV